MQGRWRLWSTARACLLLRQAARAEVSPFGADMATIPRSNLQEHERILGPRQVSYFLYISSASSHLLPTVLRC